MPELARIQTAKKTKNRYHLFVKEGEGETYACSISEDVLVKEGLQKGQQLSGDDLERLKETDALDKAFQKALNYLSYRMRSEKEIRDYLKQEEVPPEEIDDMISRLEELDFLHDARFAEAFVRTKRDQSKKGPMVIRQELFQKGISDAVTAQALEQYSEEQQIDDAIKLVEKKQHSYKKESTRQREQKLMQFLMQRGYSSAVASTAVKEADLEESQAMEEEALDKWAEKAWRKYEKDDPWKRRQKVKQALYRRGFSGDPVEAWMNEKEMEEEG
ncbi:recombination regulator RecX [Alkalicoccus urumqiensis]|nr:recombination regulator RecX [Alkalicoccus urumqiensis]